jgi:hypothetical protein
MMDRFMRKMTDTTKKILSRDFILMKTLDSEICIYQNDLMRIINILESIGSYNLAKKLRLMIFLRDYRENVMTDYRQTFKGDIRKYIMSVPEFISIEHENKKLEKIMERFYDGKKHRK